jgi:hypothetical protein
VVDVGANQGGAKKRGFGALEVAELSVDDVRLSSSLLASAPAFVRPLRPDLVISSSHARVMFNFRRASTIWAL